MSVIDHVATTMSALDTDFKTTNLAMYSYEWARKRPKGPYALNSVPYIRTKAFRAPYKALKRAL